MVSRLKAMTLKARGLSPAEICARLGCTADELAAALRGDTPAIAPGAPAVAIPIVAAPIALPPPRPAPPALSRSIERTRRFGKALEDLGAAGLKAARGLKPMAEDPPPPRGPRDIERIRPLTADRARYCRWFLAAGWSAGWVGYLFDVRAHEVSMLGGRR